MTRYVVVPEDSEVDIEARSTMHPIHGRASPVTGEIETGPDGSIIEGRLEVEVRHLSWGNRLLDRETRRRVDARTHPRITGTVVGDHGTRDGRHHLSGAITFLDATREVEGDVHVAEIASGTVVVTGEQCFDVRDWGLQPPRLLILEVEPEIRVRVRIAARASRP